MVGIRYSTEDQTLTFNAAAAVVASGLQAALASVGEVKSVDPQTGRIEGKLKAGLHDWEISAQITITVSASGSQTQVQIQTSHEEGAISMHGAQKTMDAYLQAIRQQPTLASSSTAGWTDPPSVAT